MTAITPLESIHKKGTFGDHHKKNESDLIKISEVKNLTIIQVVQYKNSKLKIESISLEEVIFPKNSLTVNLNEKTRILWNAPRTWLVVSESENIMETIQKNCLEEDFAITDISHSRAVIKIKGTDANEVLKKGCPIDFNTFQKNNCSGTVFNGINILIDKTNDKPETFNIFVLRSFGESLYHSVTDSALEFGYTGV